MATGWGCTAPARVGFPMGTTAPQAIRVASVVPTVSVFSAYVTVGQEEAIESPASVCNTSVQSIPVSGTPKVCGGAQRSELLTIYSKTTARVAEAKLVPETQGQQASKKGLSHQKPWKETNGLEPRSSCPGCLEAGVLHPGQEMSTSPRSLEECVPITHHCTR